ncbi:MULTISPECIES: hypothetical protein [Stenotrophomonas]|uniref:hypothetical protein n=1 Tax=Stenotrophomonas TaxID=40323 RepID=UPI000C14971D|nr:MULTISPECIES: hypothetical protein [Stenotrophomonas]MDH2180153.1 hypothetical protein [Stenotrophomonas sp. GD03654]
MKSTEFASALYGNESAIKPKSALLRIASSALLVLVLCAAKATVGADFRAEQLARLEVGKSTLQDAITALGTSPQNSQIGITGSAVYTWTFVESKVNWFTARGSVETKQVVLVFNPDGSFQRISDMQGVALDPPTMKRLFIDPAADATRRIQTALAAQGLTQNDARGEQSPTAAGLTVEPELDRVKGEVPASSGKSWWEAHKPKSE